MNAPNCIVNIKFVLANPFVEDGDALKGKASKHYKKNDI